jgi:two-component system, OmpR family, sensor histidine kinase VicK
MSLDALELQLASALNRFAALQRRAESPKEPVHVLHKALAELSVALEEVRVAQEQLVEGRSRMEMLQEQVRREAERYWQLFDEIPLPYIVTRADTVIVEANKAGSELLNVSQRFLVGKALSVFVCENRGAFLAQAARLAAEASHSEITIKLRPRERAPLTASARVQGNADGLRWLLQPVHSADGVVVPSELSL